MRTFVLLPLVAAIGHCAAIEAALPRPFPWPAEGEPGDGERSTELLTVFSVYLDDFGAAAVLPGTPPSALGEPVAWGSFHDAINETGWSVLDVHTSEAFSGGDQSYAAGFLEGYLTHERMKQQQRNMWGVDFTGSPAASTIDPGAKRFSEDNIAFMKEQVRAYADEDPYWRQVGFLLDQLRGLTDGYNAARSPLGDSILMVQVLMASVVDTDMDSVLTVVSLTAGQQNKQRRHRGHCSAIVQVAPGNADLWAGHATWDGYRAMLRMVKYLDMPLPGASARRVAFTSNPGSLYSGDDWYRADTGLTIFETTIDNYNDTLWRQVQPQSVLTWVRSMVATRLATSGSEWTDMQVKHQSGTCNSQWMVVDYKRFQPGQPLADGTLWISETVPGYFRREDMTNVLRGQGSWPSYNIPYFKDIWTMAGYGTMQEQNPGSVDEYSYETNVRARMFARARDEQWATDLPSFMDLLRYNRLGDPLANGNACNGLSSRCDLNPRGSSDYDCFGAVDTKVAYYRDNTLDLSFLAVSGPAHDEQERPFSWTEQDTSVDGCKAEQHVGHPDSFNFSWYLLPDRPAGPGVVGAAAVAVASSGLESAAFVAVALMTALTAALGSRRSVAYGAAEGRDDVYVQIDP